jgi:DNA-binding XRE family transcriptional regulator
MARLTKADAARQLGIARSTIYKLIEQGKPHPIEAHGAELWAIAAGIAAARDVWLSSPVCTPALEHPEVAPRLVQLRGD